jgi:hypothetical protein
MSATHRLECGRSTIAFAMVLRKGAVIEAFASGLESSEESGGPPRHGLRPLQRPTTEDEQCSSLVG